MLWPTRRELRLVLPQLLLQSLDADERAALLAHELAHVRRADHWVRRLEVIVVVLYWWLPVLWWLRRQLRDAEEKCCDAWVVWVLPDRQRSYADALLNTVDFLSGAPVALPCGASGAGRVHQLERRLTMIMEAKTPRSMGPGARLGVALLAAALLPALPTWAQEKPGPDRGAKERGKTLNEAFENAAHAVSEFLSKGNKVKMKIRKKVEIAGKDRKALLYSFIDEMIYLLDAENFIVKKAEVESKRGVLSAVLKGDDSRKYKGLDHIKAATYAEMKVGKVGGRYEIQAVVDV